MADRDSGELAPEVEIAPKPRRKTSWVRIGLMLIVPLIVIGIGTYIYLGSGRFASTDNAYVRQDIVSISPDVGGRIVEIMVGENQPVEAGDILFKIDPEPYRIAVQQADAAIADGRLELTRAETTAQTSGVDIGGAREDVAFAERNLAREQALMDRGFNTRARLESYQHELSEARERLRSAQAAQQRAQSAVGSANSGSRQAAYPAIAAAQARRADAQLDLDRTVIRAPVSGVTSQTSRLQIGQMAVQGLPMLSIVSGDGAWIEANFKETDLDRMRVGQPATIRFDAYPSLRLRGHVASIGAGTGSEFSLLPAQNATGNWVKVTQRVPVRIEFDEAPSRQMIAGLSAEVSVDLRSDAERE